MKKTVLIALVFLLICAFALSSCDNADIPSNDNNYQQTPDKNSDNNDGGEENNNASNSSAVCQHTFGEWEITKQATCKEEGILLRTCTKCSATEETIAPKSDVHHETIKEPVSATCKDAGLTEGKYCLVCNKVLIEQTIIPATNDHTPVINKRIPATCKDTGLTEGSYCSVCNQVLVKQTTVPATNKHTPVIDNGVPATCKSTGLTEGSHCSVCNRILTAQATIPKTDHKYVNDTCTMCYHSKAPSFTPDYNNGQANTIGNGIGFSRYTSQADWIYFASSTTQLSKFKKTSSSVISVYKVSSGVIHCVNVVGDWIYFYVEGSSTSNSYIAKVRTDGSSFEKILSSVTVGEMLVVKNTIFFTTIKRPYSNYAKDCAPLYCISVNGGLTKQLHDGYVSSITADATYVYFLHTLKSGSSTIYRIKHDGTKEAVLFQNANINYFVLSNAKLYFLKLDPYSDECTISSISVSGGSQTTYGKIPHYSDRLYIIGNNVYYDGMPYDNNEFNWISGIIQFNISTKKYTVLKETDETPACFVTSNYFIIENHQNITLQSISLYDVQSGSWRNVPMN